MGFGGFVSFLVVGAIVGWLASVAVREGGPGAIWDVLLGIGGSGLATVITWGGGFSEAVAAPTLVLIGAIGAAIVIAAQRKLWPVPPPVKRRRIPMATRL